MLANVGQGVAGGGHVALDKIKIQNFMGNRVLYYQCVQILRFRAKVALFATPLTLTFCKLREAQKPKKWRFLTFSKLLCSTI